MQEGVFETAYRALNAKQREAVDAIEGPVMVIAGPGTGKTQILTLRIANILKRTDTRPENILALTFTESGARAMRERLRTYIGAEAYRVPIHTFHGFCETLIRQYPDAYARVIGGRPATDVEKLDLVQEIIDDGDVRLLRPIGDSAYYTKKATDVIQTLKREFITPDRFAEIIAGQEKALVGMDRLHEKGAHKGKVRGEYAKKEKSIAKNRELLHIYRRYEAVLSDRRLYDFEDMIVETVRALESNEDMLRDLQETCQYLLADEHQDVNGSQNRILELLASYHEQPNIFVVGDEKQAIFRFQGASLENFLYFEDVFPNTTTIALTENYRSGQVVLDAAHDLIKVADGPLAELRVPLVSASGASAAVERRHFTHQAAEDGWVIGAVLSAIERNVPPEEIAVIVRTNKEVEQYAALLRRRGIAVAPSADSDILEHPVTQSVLALIAAASGSSGQALFGVLHGAYWGLAADDLTRVCAAQSFGEPLVAIIASKKRLGELGVVDPDAFLRVGEVLLRARRKASTHAPHEVLEYLIQESGLLKLVVADSPEEGTRVIRRLYDEIEAMVVRDHTATLADVQSVLAKRRAHGLPLTAPFISTDPHAVAVMTAHKSKGLEFDTVIIPHLVDSLWGGATRRTYFDIPLTRHINESSLDATDDERRLLYVAMTRAKRTLLLSHADTNADAKDLSPSRLFEYIGETHMKHEDTAAHEAAFDPVSLLGTPAAEHSLHSERMSALLKTVFLERGLSATALNNYLTSPWNYFYRNVLRIPEVQSESMLFGTAMHSVMDRAIVHHTKEGALPSDTQIKQYLESALARLPITAEQYTQLHEKGLPALIAYLRHATPSLPKKAEAEFSIRVMLPTGRADLPEIPLTGKLDRLDFDEEGRVIRVIDYKTGKPKSRNVIEGKTKDSNGDYKRQLVFYALLLSLLEDERYACRDGVISYLEPDQKGAIREEPFTITDEEIEELRGEILRVADEITNGTFLSTPCDPAVSNYCAYVELLRQQER
jgi:DNA helicase-2/ATP-dependent DNA helicase PcrA